MTEDAFFLVAAVVVGALLGTVWHHIKRWRLKSDCRGKRSQDKATHVSLYIPAVFPAFALAMRWPEDDSPQQLHEDH